MSFFGRPFIVNPVTKLAAASGAAGAPLRRLGANAGFRVAGGLCSATVSSRPQRDHRVRLHMPIRLAHDAAKGRHIGATCPIGETR